MGRKLMRVPLDFSWPTGKVWGGYVNPYSSQSIKCDACDGSSYSPQARLFRDQWYNFDPAIPFDPVAYGATPLALNAAAMQHVMEIAWRNTGRCRELEFVYEMNRLYRLMSQQWCHHIIQSEVDALVVEGRLMDLTHRPRTPEQAAQMASGEHWMTEPNGHQPSADEVNAWSIDGCGHDSINAWICLKARCQREGVEPGCSKCSGEGTLWPSEAIKQAHEEWEAFDPPTGDGFQLWETTSDGSPASPVFDSLDALCAWAAENATVFGAARATQQRWREMLNADLVVHQEGSNVFY